MRPHNQHSETRRPSDRDRIVTTEPSRFQPARPEVFAEMMSVSVAGIPKNRWRTTIPERMVETRAELPFIGNQVGRFRAQPGRPKRRMKPIPGSELTVDFDGREVSYGFGELDELVLAYATTIHKSQGSEYPAVVIPLSTQHYPMLERNLVYTGVTRGKRLVVLLGQRKAMAIAVKGARVRRR